MNTDRFKNYEEEVRQLVLGFEAMQRQGDSRYYDVEELETIIDFYLDTSDMDMLEKSVRYGEALFPTSNEIRLRHAHLLCIKERYKEALTMLKELEQMEPDNPDVLYAIGVTYSALEQSRKAIQYFHKSAAEGSELGIIYSNIADEYAKMDQLGEARNYYRKALRLNPDDEHSLYELANCYEDEGLIDKWIHYYQRFVKEHPYSAVAWFCLGEGYMATELYERAIDAYKFAIAIDEQYFYAYYQMASCYYKMEEYNEAINALHDAAKQTEDKAYVYYRIAEIFRQIQNPTTAVVYYRKAVHEDPYYGEAWHALSFAYCMLQQFDAAIDAAKHAIKIDPESPLYLTTLALIYAENRYIEEAERIFELARPYYADFEQGWLGYADFLILQGRYGEAIDALNEGLPDCELVFEFNKRLALCYWETGRRNLLYNAVRACIYYADNGDEELLDYIPELRGDAQVMDIIASYKEERAASKD